MATKKVFIGVGHGGNDPGAVGYVVEKNANLKMALACRDLLEDAGVQVLMSRTVDESETMNQKVNECNSFHPDLCIDVHNNAGGGDGFEAYHTVKGGTGKVLAQNIEAEVKAIGQNSRGVKTRKNSSGSDYYAFIRQTLAPAVILEGAFVDTKADAEQIDTDAECKKFGYAYAKGVLKTLGIDYKPIQEPEVQQSKDKLYRVQLGAFSDKANAEKLAKELKSKGYDTYIA